MAERWLGVLEHPQLSKMGGRASRKFLLNDVDIKLWEIILSEGIDRVAGLSSPR